MTTTETNESIAARPSRAESPRKQYVAAWPDTELADALQVVADKTARGNRTLIVERYVRAGLEREKVLPRDTRQQFTNKI